MKIRLYKTPIALIIFFACVFISALALNPRYPIRVIAGEDSVGTWMSGVLLIISATSSLISIRRGWWPWFPIFVFFVILALDERFMFHEHIKEKIIFSTHYTSRWILEIPVIAGALIGAFVSTQLWKHLSRNSRILLVIAIVFGVSSVVIDILAVGVLWEEIFKLIAELIVACTLLANVEE